MPVNQKCPICNGRMMEGHITHALQMVSAAGESLAFIISISGPRNSGPAVARRLALARHELREYFPRRNFEILPTAIVVPKVPVSGAIPAFFAEYAVIEV